MSHKQVLGVADNKSYKSMSHFDEHFFNRNDRDNLPSLNVDPPINTSIKKNPYRSNVEIEKDEVILTPDLSALFKARGKTHKQGGIDVMLAPDSFVFSDDKTLAFTEKDHKKFEFKEGGTFKRDKNTPAEVLKRNIDVKHYNTLTSNIQDVKKDDLAKKSSMMMLEKYLATLGNIAYLQEAKKGLPTGVPSFSEGTAPVYNANLKDQLMQQKQYAKYGGPIDNPYKMQIGGSKQGYGAGNQEGAIQQFGDKTYMFTNGKWKDVTPAPGTTPYPNMSNLPSYSHDKYYGQGNKEGVTQQFGDQNYIFTNGKWKMIDPSIETLPGGDIAASQEKQGKHSGVPFEDDPDPLKIKRYMPPNPLTSQELRQTGLKITGVPEGIKPPEITGGKDNGKDLDWKFSPWQRISQGYNLGKLASLKRYMPMRSQFSPTYADPSLVNPEQAIGDVQGLVNTSTRALNTLNPILRNAQASAYTGDLMDKVPGIRSQYDNQNAGIQNQFRGMNTQITNNARTLNMKNDQDYYQQTIKGQSNFDNMKTYLGDQYMNNLMTDVQDNQTLNYNLMTLDNPAYSYDWRSTGFKRNPKDIRDVKSNGIDARYLELLRQADSITDPDKKLKYLIDLEKISAFKGANRLQKKGGKISNNPYK